MSIPHFSSRWFSPREPVRIRSGLALPNHVSKAIAELNRNKSEVSRNSAIFLAIAHAYGLRRLEAMGLEKKQFDDQDPLCLSVRRTQIADLKSPSGRRVIASSIVTESVDKHIKGAVALARTTSRKTGFIFESPTRDNLIAQVRPIISAATEALRHATGSVNVVPHTLRHSFATILGLALFAPPKGSKRNLELLAQSYLSQSYSHQVAKILQTPKDWPFGVDAIAMALGQADSSTFLNVYFHGSHLVIADRCESWQPKRITQIRLATMLNAGRTSLSKLGTKISLTTDAKAFNAEAVVREHVRRIDKFETAGTTQSDTDSPSIQPSLRWELFFRALLYRLEQNISLEGMKMYATDGLGFTDEFAERLIKGYARVVGETEFDDFEPDSSSIVKPLASHRTGIIKGVVEREDFVARAQKWAESSPENANRLKILVGNWFTRVNAIKPSLVCHSLRELTESVGILVALGATPDQLHIQMHGDTSDSWLVDVAVKYPTAAPLSTRASRGSARVKLSEASISVSQTAKSRIPDGRDLHRAFIGLHVALFI